MALCSVRGSIEDILIMPLGKVAENIACDNGNLALFCDSEIAWNLRAEILMFLRASFNLI